MKDVGLVGMPGAGKSTLFTALTKAGSAGGRDNQAVVPVPDPRLGVLAAMERSRKVVHAQVRFVDVPGATSARGLAALREADALAVVVRAFGGAADAAGELASVTAELILADMAVVESALEGARKRTRTRSKEAEAEVAALEKAQGALSAETLLRDAGMAAEEHAVLRGLAPLTSKPWVVVANMEEGVSDLPPGLPDDTVLVWAGIEAETAGMDDDEARSLLEEFGVPEPGLDRVVAASYRVMDLITFLTTGEDETRAWEVRRGAMAPEAAGAIHTDLQRGFIRAEVVSYDELVAAGGWDAAKAAGKLRVEGKDYVVAEGDVLHIRFSV
jgi:ribosome-binding ATPase YchF (GTP1/OBG family)